MDWIVRTRDQKDNRGCERHYDTEHYFISGVKELLENRWQRIVSATLPDGVVLDEEKLRQLIFGLQDVTHPSGSTTQTRSKPLPLRDSPGPALSSHAG